MPREAAFGVAHRRRVVAVERPEVARSVDERVAQRERLRHAHERLVERGVAVRVVVAHHVADDLRALAVLGVGRQVLLPHRVEDAALHRLEPVAHVRQRARGDDREGVVQVPRLRGLVQRHAFFVGPGGHAPARGRARDDVGVRLHAIEQRRGLRLPLGHGGIVVRARAINHVAHVGHVGWTTSRAFTIAVEGLGRSPSI